MSDLDRTTSKSSLLRRRASWCIEVTETTDESIDVLSTPELTLRSLLPMAWALPTPLTATFDYLGWDAGPPRQVSADAVKLLERHVPDAD